MMEDAKEMGTPIPEDAATSRSPWAEAWRRLRVAARQLAKRAAPRRTDPHETYVRLAVQLALEKPSPDRGKVLLLTSPTGADVIRRAGLEFAEALSREMNRRVLVIEADFGNLRTPETPGLTDLLWHGTNGFKGVVRPTADPLVFRLPSGSPELVPASFGAGRHREVLDWARAAYDVVMLLGSPVLREQKWLPFGPFVDHALLLAVEEETYLADLEASLRLLRECSVAGVGVVLARGGGPAPDPTPGGPASPAEP
jgi:Mrp family chromosome partitioning ATPase